MSYQKLASVALTQPTVAQPQAFAPVLARPFQKNED